MFLEGLEDLELASVANRVGWTQSRKRRWGMRLESSTGCNMRVLHAILNIRGFFLAGMESCWQVAAGEEQK